MSTPAATSPVPPLSAGREPAPDWAETYFRALAESRQKALAALAAGQKLPTIARQRFTDPAFAQREAEILETLADLLESEAVRRVTARAPIRKVCSDSLLSRLLQIFHPRWSLVQKEALAQRAPLHGKPHRPVRARGEFNFRTATQRFEFRQWEREEAIALALRLFHAEFEALPPCPIPFSRRASHRTVIKHRQQAAATTTTRTTPASNSSTTEEQGGPAQPLAASSESCPCAIRPEPLRGSQDLPRNVSENLSPARSPGASQDSSRPVSQNARSNCHPGTRSTPDAPQSSPPISDSPEGPARPPSLGRRLLWGLAMPPESKTGIKPYPGFIPWLIKVGAIKPPGAAQPPVPPPRSPHHPRPDSS